MIPLQLGDIATRIRRFTRATGNIGVELDQKAVPVVVLADLNQAPYASEPKRCAIHLSTGFDSVHTPSLGVRAGTGAVLVIDSVWLEGTTAVEVQQLAIIRNISASVFTAQYVDTSLIDLSDPGANPLHFQPQTCTSTGGSSNSAAPLVGNVVIAQPVSGLPGTLVQLLLPEPVVLFGAFPANIINSVGGVNPLGDVLLLIGTNTGQGIAATFWGREYALLQGPSA